MPVAERNIIFNEHNIFQDKKNKENKKIEEGINKKAR